MHGVSGEVCWGVGAGEGSCGKRYGGCGGRCVGVWEEVRKNVWGRVWESVWGERGSVLACGGRNGGGVEKCVRVWGPNIGLLPHISSLTSLPSPFPTSTLTSPTPQHTFLHLLSYLFPHLPFLPPRPQNIFLLSPHLPSPLSVAKLPCDKVTVVKLPCGEVTCNHF